MSSAEQIIVPNDAQPPVTMRVSVFDKQVVQHFPHPLEWLALTGEEALRLGYVLIERAWEARPDLKPLDGEIKHELIERHRRTLTKRLEVVLNTQRERKRVSNHDLARQLTEIMLKEVFS